MTGSDPRRLRTKAIWLLVIPFFWLATPSANLLAIGAALAAVGLAIRAWAAGTIHKDEGLTTSGPYAHVRHPLYVGSFLIGIGVTIAGGHWAWPLTFVLFYGYAYARTLRYEAAVLTELFGDRYAEYAAQVPPVIPRFTPYQPTESAEPKGFTLARYRRNNEWEALLGALAAFGILAAKAVLSG